MLPRQIDQYSHRAYLILFAGKFFDIWRFGFDNLKLCGVRRLAASKIACALTMVLLPATMPSLQLSKEESRSNRIGLLVALISDVFQK